MRHLTFVFCVLFPLSVFADDVCPPGYQSGEYIELEYIESNGTQYINTEYHLSSTRERIVIEVSLTNSYRDNIIFGNSGSGMVNINLYTGILYYRYGGYDSHSVTTDTTQKHKYEIGSNGGYLDDNLIYTFDNPNGILDSPLYLFAMNENSTPAYNIKGKIYSFKIFDGNELKLNMIPILRLSDNTIGMYDTVNDKFYTNSGTGEFIAGPGKQATIIQLNNIACAACPYNTYKPNAGNEYCTHCPTGTFSPIGSTSLSDCAKILRVNDYVVYMPVGRRTEHGLCTMLDGKKYCADVYERQ